jgi:hypothetical protein
MAAFTNFWNANTLMIGIVCSVLAVAIAAVLHMGTLATVVGLIAGTAFMWLGKPDAPSESEEEA